jgi:hypothetical protein
MYLLPIAFNLDLSPESTQKILLSLALPVVTTIVSFVVGRWWGKYLARRQWDRKDFGGRIIVSLNLLNDNRLRIRTIVERTLEEMFPNAIAVDKIRAAAKRTTIQNPMLPIAREDCWYLLNFVLNHVAEHFVQGVVRMDAGQPVTKMVYGLFLTCEQVGEERIRKVRAMLIRKEHLESFPYPEKMPELENPWHSDRILTLRKASEVYKTNPEQFLFLEVCV